MAKVLALVVLIGCLTLPATYSRSLHHSTQYFPTVAVINQEKHGLITDIKPRKKLPSSNGKFKIFQHPVKLNLWKPSSGEKLAIPYSFATDFPFKSEVIVAVAAINKHLKCGHDVWVPYTNQNHRVEFTKKHGCWSSLGKNHDEKGKQDISIDSGCEPKNIILHEMMHAMGFHHEHNRVDRDKYIDILKENIQNGLESQFEKAGQNNYYETNVGYDYMSIMHYDLKSFSKNGKRTMILKPTKEAKALTAEQRKILGNVPDLSEKDIKELRMYFKCDGNDGKDTSSPTDLTTAKPRTKTFSTTTETPTTTTENPSTATENTSTTTENPSTTTDEYDVISKPFIETSGEGYISDDDEDLSGEEW